MNTRHDKDVINLLNASLLYWILRNDFELWAPYYKGLAKLQKELTCRVSS
jgi:hypothetical protein